MIDLEGFENHLREREVSENTIACYRNGIMQYVHEKGDGFTKEKIVDFKWKMIKTRKATTVNLYLVVKIQRRGM